MVGVDEVGRGCWAGPLLVVAARQRNDLPPGLTDSKLLTRETREAIYQKLRKSCKFGEGWVEPREIDQAGLAEALRSGFARAIDALGVNAEEKIVIDGTTNYAPITYTNVSCIIDADQHVAIVSAASVYAKVARDRFMKELSKRYPDYGFESHVGYGTKAHRQALQSAGAIKYVHRFSYRPLMEFAA